MNLMAIRDHLRLACRALGAEHPLSARIGAIERALTPGDPSFRNDAVSAENDLLAVSAELERLPDLVPPRIASDAGERLRPAQQGPPPGVDEALRQIAAAIELL